MFRKIHSNRDPKATLYSEIKKEFAPYFEKAASRTESTFRSYPKPFFWAMIALLLLSVGLSFTVFRKPATTQSTLRASTKPARKSYPNDGFERILSTGAALKRTLQIRSTVEAITSKDKLNHADSLALEAALDSLAQLQKQINHTP